MVYRVFAEKKEGYRAEATGLKNDAKTLLGISRLEDVRVINRYDVENIGEEVFEESIWKVFAEPQLDNSSRSLVGLTGFHIDENGYAVIDEIFGGEHAYVFAVETLPGQLDQRADSAEQCIQLISRGDRPTVRSARVYVLYGELMPADIDAIKNHVINKAKERESSMEKPETLATEYETPGTVATLEGFTTMEPGAFRMCIDEMGLAMDEDDLGMCVDYFRDTEHRDPTITELRLIDTYWSDRCRHTNFNTVIDSVTIEDPLLEKAYMDYLTLRKDLGRNRPVTLMDIASIAVNHLKRDGKIDKLDESDETDACTIKINVEVDGIKEPWLLLFKNGSNNDQTETDPFRGAANCLGGCIRDPLSGRAYAYSAMRVTGAADPLLPVTETLPGKLPQRTITQKSAKGYSSYGNQTGIATGMVDEIYHPGYAAKRMEVGAVMAAAPAVNVRRGRPEPGDVVMLVGADGRKGDPLEEHKLQRLFRSGVATRMIKRCKGFGAGGASVAIGGLADGLEIDLDKLSERYDGQGVTELATAESQERMACVVAPGNEELFVTLATEENLRCVKVAVVTEEPRLVMRWNGNKTADISREFLNTNGADKHIDIAPDIPGNWNATSMYRESRSFTAAMKNIAQNLNTCSKRGLAERFDSTIGAGSVLMPFGGKNQLTPIQAMVHKIPLEEGETDDCSLMAFGYNPFISSASPYHGAYLAVVESVAKLIATGASFEDVYLLFQEYFGSPGDDGKRWGKPLAALLGAFEAQKGLSIAAIGGSNSMNGSFEDIDVPPTLISFAVTTGKVPEIISPEFKAPGHKVIWLRPYIEEDNRGVGKGLPEPASLIKVWNKAYDLIKSGKAVAAYAPGMGGVAEAIMKMSYGNGIGFSYLLDDYDDVEAQGKTYSANRYKNEAMKEIFGYSYGSIILELAEDEEIMGRSLDIGTLGYTCEDTNISFADESLEMRDLLMLYEGKLESVFPNNTDTKTSLLGNVNYAARSWDVTVYKRSKPRVLIPAFPGTNCEYDSARVVREAGAVPEILVIRDRSSEEIKRSIDMFAARLRDSQIVFIPGGCSGGGGPDGSAKLITAFFRNPEISEGITELLDKREGLMLGICDGFQALIKLGLVPYGKIMDVDADCPTLTYNTLGAHQSKIVRVRVASNKSPWLRHSKVGDIYSVPVSHSEGRFIAPEEELRRLASMGQIATQYVDLEGNATGDIRFNPSGSMLAVEGITSPDGRVFGKMGHAERVGKGLYKNVDGNYFMNLFENAVDYFK